jgi:hypothetical protein
MVQRLLAIKKIRQTVMVICILCLLAFGLAAQNVGIGINNPLYKLHVGNGANGLRIEGPATAGTGNTSLSIAGYGDVVIDKPGIVGGRLTIKENGNVGIGTGDPGFPLNFPNSTGDKISLFGNSGAHYGFGIQPFLLQIHSGANSDDIAFGYGNSTSFTESMRIKGNGNVGIGTSAPNAPLQFNNNAVNRKLVLYDVNNDDNQFYGFGINAGVLRYQVNSIFSDHVFYAGTSPTASNELLRIKGSGALSLGGNTGQPGQVLTSNGNAGAPSWQNGGSNNIFIAPQTASLALSNGVSDVPGLVANFTLNVPSKVLFHYSGSLFSAMCFGCPDKSVFLFLHQNLAGGGSTQISRAIAHVPTQVETSVVSGPDVLDLPAGVHSFKVVMNTSGANTATLNAARLTWQIFPQ